jgi:ubiquitin carboxyl-terminal hydrolase 4/11/15
MSETTATEAAFPSPEKQKQYIKALNNELEFTQKKGDSFFLISQKWWNMWKLYVNYDDTGDISNGPPPKPSSIDNTDLLENGELKRNLIEGVHYSILFAQVWSTLVTWYGGGPAIERKLIETGVSKQLVVEVYPLRLTLRRHGQANDIVTSSFSRAMKLKELKMIAATRFYIPPHSCYLKLDLGAKGKRDLSDMEKTLEEAGIHDESLIWACPDPNICDESPEFVAVKSAPVSNESASSAPAAATRPQSEPQQHANVMLDDVERGNMDSSDSDTGLSPLTRAGEDEEESKSGGLFSTMWSGITNVSARLRGKERAEDDDEDDDNMYELSTSGRKSTRAGITGLQNLGNTFFMNSALQCLSNTEPLTRYFLENKYKNDINRKNPLGSGGKMAEEYAKLLKRMWSGKYSSVAPIEFKWIVGRFAPQFSGYNQHDSQELLAFLLDGLHEDLNRVTVKPYVEKKEHDGRDDELVAQDAWQDHLKRNQSIIVDLFQGQLRSTVVCPTCNYVSVTFDPFMYLSLPLPTVGWRIIRVIFFPLENDKPIAYFVKIEKKAKIGDLKEKLAEMTGKKPNTLLLADVYNHKIFQLLDDRSNVSNIRDTDVTAAYEIIPQANATKDNILYIQVVHRVKDTKYSFESYDLIGFPTVLSIPLEKTSDPNYVFTNNDFYNLLATKIKRYINTRALEETPSSSPSSSSERQEPFTLFVTSNVIMGGTEIPRNDLPLSLNGRDCVCVQWKSLDFFNGSAEKNIEERGDKEIESTALTLKDCLTLFCQTERLGKNDEWYCPKCKEFVQATKKFDLWKLPEILVIHLKRFQYTKWWRDKIDTYVDYPISGLDLSEFVLSAQYKKMFSCVYDLFAISVHSGGLGGGHYTAFALNPLDKHWYYFNDSSVQMVDEKHIKVDGAYVLFYRRRSPLASSCNKSPTSIAFQSQQQTQPSSSNTNANTVDMPSHFAAPVVDDDYSDTENNVAAANHDLMQTE